MRGVLAVLAIVMPAVDALAGRPLTVDDAGTAAVGTLEVEVGLGFVKDPTRRGFGCPMALATGVVRDLEIGLASGGLLEEREEADGRTFWQGGTADLLVASKWSFLRQAPTWPAMALAATAKLPTADPDRGLGSGETDFDLSLLLSRYGERAFRVGAHLNLGWTWIGGDGDRVHYGVAVEAPLGRFSSVVAELFANTPVGQARRTGVAGQVGLRKALFEGGVLDGAVGAGVRGDMLDVAATAEFTWEFPLWSPADRRKANVEE
jgi:hypothetical protein